MRQSWRRLAAVLLLLLVMAAAALLLLPASGSEFVAGTLSRLLGRRVEVAVLDLRLGHALEVELGDLRVYDEDEAQPIFTVRRAIGSQSWPRLLTGRFLPRRWRLEQPHLVVRTREGSEPAALPPIPPLELTVVDGSVEWFPAEGEPVRVERLRVSGSQAPLRAGVVGSAMGLVRRGGAPIGSFALEFDGWIDAMDVVGNVDRVALDAIGWHGIAPTSGEARGSVSLSLADGELEGSLDLEAEQFVLELPDFHGPIAPRELRVAADLSWRGEVLRVNVHPFQVDDLLVRGDVALGRGPEARVVARLDVEAFQPGLAGERLQLIRLIGLRHKLWADLDERTRAGWLEDVRFELDVPVAALVDTLAFRRVTQPHELRIFARVRDGVYQASEDATPIEGISGEIELLGDHLQFSDLRMSREGEPLPEIHVGIDGMPIFVRLPPDERKVPEGPGTPIPGLTAIFDSFESEDPEAETVVRIAEAQIGYTAFLLPARDVEGLLRFRQGKLLVEAEGVVGGAPARVDAEWSWVEDRVTTHIRYALGEHAPPRVDPGPYWTSGRFAVARVELGDWPLEQVTGALRAEGAMVELTDLEALLEGGPLEAQGYASLAEEEAAPFGFVVDVTGADAAGIARILELDEGTLSGRMAADGTIAGRLSPDRLFLEDADVRLRTRIEQAMVGNLPLTVVMARLASPLGWTGLFGRPLPCDQMTADLVIQKGILRTENFALEGPELRALAAGEIDVISDDLETDMMVALLFLQSVDQVLGRVPLVGRWILGPDRNLVALYFHVEGPWEEPDAGLVAPTTLQTATGWAGSVIGRGVRRVRDMLMPSNGRSRGDGAGNGSRAPESSRQDPGP